jgi:hypothetical protein
LRAELDNAKDAARTEDREDNEIQGILIRSVEKQKNLDEIQNILHLRRPNAKDFDRACQNTKSDVKVVKVTYQLIIQQVLLQRQYG